MQEKRKGIRRTLERPVWIVTEEGAEPIQCTLKDMSKSGARLSVVAGQLAIPPSFVLHLANNGAVARKCVVVWKSEAGDEIGIEFVARRVVGAPRPAYEVEI
jgi:hypothetical protein